MVVIPGRRPNTADFASGEPINETFNWAYDAPEPLNSRDYWLYIAFLPDKNNLVCMISFLSF